MYGRERADSIMAREKLLSPQKAEYIGADQTVILNLRLQFHGGPYIR